MERLMRLPAVLAMRGRGVSAHYYDMKRGLFPLPVPIGGHSVAWPESEVAAINAARIAGKTEDEIRALVRKLHAARKRVAP